MSYSSIVSETAVVRVYTNVNDIHDVWSFTVYIADTCRCNTCVTRAYRTLPLPLYCNTVQDLNFVGLNFRCFRENYSTKISNAHERAPNPRAHNGTAKFIQRKLCRQLSAKFKSHEI